MSAIDGKFVGEGGEGVSEGFLGTDRVGVVFCRKSLIFHDDSANEESLFLSSPLTAFPEPF